MGNIVCRQCMKVDYGNGVADSNSIIGVELLNHIKAPSRNLVFKPPDRFTRKYDIRGLIGSGATGQCHVCLQLPNHDIFACKIVRKRRLLQERKQRILKQLRVEVDVLKRLSHPNIVKFQDFYEDRNHLFIIMELVGGGELFAQVVEVGSFSEKIAAGIIKDVAAGLEYCHSMGIIHRDLKPENLLVPGPGLRPVKICDFGLAFQYGAKREARTFVGSPRYMAPEQMQRKPYTSKVDTWALGVILFILLSGCLPFEPALLKKGEDQKLPVRELALKFEGKRWQRVSGDAKSLIFYCLSLDPEIRFSADKILTHPWLNGKAPDNLIRNSQHLRRYLTDKRSNGSFFLEPNTLSRKDVKAKIAATHRDRRSQPMSLNRGYRTPDGAASLSPSNSSRSLDKAVLLKGMDRFRRTPSDKCSDSCSVRSWGKADDKPRTASKYRSL
mmetsp:Transcript_30179/g.42060  ORF Transcript_30179/g.42060 Transcript_30179/m.42060 type:complete len:441 (-) Transcript_30179:227-1549(-)|eukprot:CAMPEP_0185253866 /NCGR_PEP_ID=MMETSP1359-20130426/2428_1 /TAXON_ID=552665 /ORGANISM="Bigelowiella longifila, Strain CCMP242" /LENGTH=440 /DNA_ID=CAMNT_0027836297 /DNA_START=127 /DNA_END=1449 /DNA_ORIENTATION=-